MVNPRCPYKYQLGAKKGKKCDTEIMRCGRKYCCKHWRQQRVIELEKENEELKQKIKELKKDADKFVIKLN